MMSMLVSFAQTKHCYEKEAIMKKGGNANHPKKGDRIKVDPIRKIKDIRAVSKLTAGNPRDHLLFLIGVNNGLRAGDLIKLKVKDVRHLKVGDTLTIKESKTGKDNILVVNKTVYKALRNYLDAVQPDDSAFLFSSRKGNGHIQSQAVSKLIKKWTGAINLKGNYGAHTLRKTWGYIQRTVHGVGFEIICKRYNHSSPAVTMRYLGIQDKEVHATLMNEIG
jgi:integrase